MAAQGESSAAGHTVDMSQSETAIAPRPNIETRSTAGLGPTAPTLSSMTIPAQHRGRDRTLPSAGWAFCVVASAVLSTLTLSNKMSWVSHTYIMDAGSPLVAQERIDWPRPRDGSVVARTCSLVGYCATYEAELHGYSKAGCNAYGTLDNTPIRAWSYGAGCFGTAAILLWIAALSTVVLLDRVGCHEFFLASRAMVLVALVLQFAGLLLFGRGLSQTAPSDAVAGFGSECTFCATATAFNRGDCDLGPGAVIGLAGFGCSALASLFAFRVVRHQMNAARVHVARKSIISMATHGPSGIKVESADEGGAIGPGHATRADPTKSGLLQGKGRQAVLQSPAGPGVASSSNYARRLSLQTTMHNVQVTKHIAKIWKAGGHMTAHASGSNVSHMLQSAQVKVPT